jgi:hypothetical protein
MLTRRLSSPLPWFPSSLWHTVSLLKDFSAREKKGRCLFFDVDEHVLHAYQVSFCA